MKLHMLVILAFAVLVSGVVCGDVRAQDPLEFDDDKQDESLRDWGLAITPYVWFAGQSSDIGGKELRQSFNDLASIANFGFQARILARWRWLNFTADWTYADLQSETRIALVDVDLSIVQHILDMKVGGLVYDTRTPELDGGIGLWAAAGVRYWNNDVDYRVTTNPILPGGTPVVEDGKDSQGWWDPVLGVFMHFPITPKVSFLVRATGGGFGIGNASSYLWDAEFTALFRVSERFLVSGGYRQFKYDRTDDGLKQTVTVTGPQIGLSIGIM